MNTNKMNNKNTAIDNHEANQDMKVISYITAILMIVQILSETQGWIFSLIRFLVYLLIVVL